MRKNFLSWISSPLRLMFIAGALPLVLLLGAIIWVPQEESTKSILTSFLIFFAGVYSTQIVFIWQKQLARELSPRSNESLLKFQVDVCRKLKCLANNCNATLHEGDPNEGYDFVLCKNDKPWVLIEIKSEDTWKYPTTKIVCGTIDRLKCAMKEKGADRGIIVVEGKGKAKDSPDPFDLEPENIELCTLSGIDDLLQSLAAQSAQVPSQTFAPHANKSGLGKC